MCKIVAFFVPIFCYVDVEKYQKAVSVYGIQAYVTDFVVV